MGFVITDIRMPGMNGCDLARMLLAERPSLAVLLVSGLHSGSTARSPFLQKPFTAPWLGVELIWLPILAVLAIAPWAL